MPHRNFWIDFGCKLGPPLFAASVVGCLLQGSFDWVHGLLIGAGFGLVLLDHRFAHHRA